MTRRTHAWLLGFALLGLLASLSSTYVHYRIIRDPTYTSICSINRVLDCETAYASRYGTIRGVPVALAGLIWFALSTALLLTIGPASAKPHTGDQDGLAQNVAAYVYVLSTVGLGVVVYFAYASVFVLKTVCLFCFITYVAMIGLFVMSGRASDATFGSIPGRMSRDLRRLAGSPAALVMALLLVGGAASALALFPRDIGVRQADPAPAAAPEPVSPTQQAEFDRWFGSEPRAELVVPTDGASVLLVKFNDYQCPACADTYFRHKSVLAKYQAAYPGEVKFVNVDFPLAPECNAGLQVVVHPAACAGAVAVRLARRSGKEEAMKEWLYSHQRGLMPDEVRRAAREVAGVTDFDREYSRLLALVKQDAEMGNRLHVDGTPTFFINGVRIDGGLRADYLDAAIAHELRRAGVIND